MLQCKIISVGLGRGGGSGGYVCWASTVQILHTGLFANKTGHVYIVVHTFFASLLAKGADESTLPEGCVGTDLR